MDLDERLNEKQQNYWLKWLKRVSALPQFRAPQWYDLSGYKGTDTQLHTLFDASEAAYSNVVYVKIILSLKIFIAYYKWINE